MSPGDRFVRCLLQRGDHRGRDARGRAGVKVPVDHLGDRLDGPDPIGHGRVVLGQHHDAVPAAAVFIRTAGEAADAVDPPAIRGQRQPAVLDVHDQAPRRPGRHTPALGSNDVRHQGERVVAGGGVEYPVRLEQQPQQPGLVGGGDPGEPPRRARAQDRVRHPGQVQEVLQPGPPGLGPQRGRGAIVRPGDHRPGQRPLGPGERPVLRLGLAEQRAQDDDLHHAGRVKVRPAVEPAHHPRPGVVDLHRDEGDPIAPRGLHGPADPAPPAPDGRTTRRCPSRRPPC